jgi:DNA-binding transcriptional LysR family regulator
MLDLSAVRSLIAVRDHGTVVAAADALGFTPSAVSQQIKRLERQSGCSMLEHVGRGVILSERGRLVADQGQRLLAELEELENLALGDGRRPTGEFRIASFYTAGRGVVAPLIARLAQTAPDLRVLLHEIDPRECLSVIERGGADLGIVHDWETVPLDLAPTLESVRLFTDTADVLLPVDHPLAEADAVDAAELLQERWVSTHSGAICDDWLNQMFAMHGARPNVPFRDSNFSTHVGLVEQRVAVALLPRLGRERLPDTVRAVPVRNPTPQRHVYSVWRRASADNHVRRHVQEQLVGVLATLQGRG